MADRHVTTCKVIECSKLTMALGMCSMHYSRQHRHGDPLEEFSSTRNCDVCGAEFGAFGRVKTCSPECSYVRRREYYRAYQERFRSENPVVPKVDEYRQCDFCGETFGANRKRSRYCSDACAEANKNRANWPYMTRRRARLRGATVELFDRAEIFERDNWVCGICDDPIDRDATFPDPQSASLDHVFPLARGGTHSRANAQAAHLGCNSRKGAKVA